jgi:hypothetical protein
MISVELLSKTWTNIEGYQVVLRVDNHGFLKIQKINLDI